MDITAEASTTNGPHASGVRIRGVTSFLPVRVDRIHTTINLACTIRLPRTHLAIWVEWHPLFARVVVIIVAVASGGGGGAWRFSQRMGCPRQATPCPGHGGVGPIRCVGRGRVHAGRHGVQHRCFCGRAQGLGKCISFVGRLGPLRPLLGGASK